MSLSYLRTLLILLTISASTLSLTPELGHGQAAETGKANPFLKPRPHKSVPYLMAKKRSAEFVPSDPVNVLTASILSKRFPAPTRQDTENIRPNTISGIQTQTSLTASSTEQLKSLKADTLSFTPEGSAKDIGQNMPTIQKNKISRDDNGLSTSEHVRGDIKERTAELFLQELIENAVRMLDLSLLSSAPPKYRGPVESAHQVQIPWNGFMKRKAKTEGKRPFDRLASGLIGKRSGKLF